MASSSSSTCVLQPSSMHCIISDMYTALRTFVLLILLGGMLISASLGTAAAQTAALEAVTSTPCCPDDCPPKPECGPACAAVMQCRVAPASMTLESSFMQSADTYLAIQFAMADAAISYFVVQTGLRRPPRG